ncbi:MAG TPA: hypothetical protein VHP38_14740 [Ruminiclostridium sp.]|nr:hypothetical protein [Ruminiclostridium sp.]
MLKLENPQIIDGITVYPDHADKNQFYYLPGPISLSRDSQGKQNIFHLWIYRQMEGKGGGGFMNFQVDLDIGEKIRNDIISELKKNGAANPRLSPPVWSEGKVKCIGLDIRGDKPGDFVTMVNGAAVPSLSGDNSAIFSLSLSRDGAVLCKNSFSSKTSPIGVIYELKYTALRPALDVKVTGSYKNLYSSLSTSLSAQYGFIKADIDDAFEKLVKDKVIKIEVSNFVPDGKKAEQEKWALEFFKAQIASQWFEPTLTPGSLKSGFAKAEDLAKVKERGAKPGEDPKKPSGGDAPKPSGGGKTDSDAEKVKELAAAATGMPIVSFALKHVHQEELGEINMDFHSEEAETRICAPQGFLGLFVQNMKESDYISEIDLKDPFFETLDVTVRPPEEMDKISLSAASVTLKYKNVSQKTFSFDKNSAAPAHYIQNLDKNLSKSYTYDLNFTFRPDDTWDGESMEYDFEGITAEAAVLPLLPNQYIYFKNVGISVAPGFDWKMVDYVEVICDYTGPKGWKAKTKRCIFSKDQSLQQTWKLRMGKVSELDSPDKKKYSYQIKYHMNNGTAVTSTVAASDADSIIIPRLKGYEAEFSTEDIPVDKYKRIYVYIKNGDDTEELVFKNDGTSRTVYLSRKVSEGYEWRVVVYPAGPGRETVYYPEQSEESGETWKASKEPIIYLSNFLTIK